LPQASFILFLLSIVLKCHGLLYRTTAFERKCVFTARRNASAVLGICYSHVSVCPSVTSLYSVETAGRIELGFGIDVSFDFYYTVL